MREIMEKASVLNRGLTMEERLALADFSYRQQADEIARGNKGECYGNLLERYQDDRKGDIKLDLRERRDVFMNSLHPTISCDSAYRFGPVADGGYWVCDPHRLIAGGRKCIVYGFGVQDDLGFENTVARLLGCEVHAFDPCCTKEQLKSWGELPDGGGGVVLHQAPVTSSGENSIVEWAKRLGHDHVDVIKVDIEGEQRPIVNSWFSSGALEKLKVSQVVYENHATYHPANAGENWCQVRDRVLAPRMKDFYNAGYFLFNYEANPILASLVNYHWVHRDYLLGLR